MQTLKDLRNSSGFSQRGLARWLGMGTHGERNVRRWEKGDSPVPGCVIVALKWRLAAIDLAGYIIDEGGDDRIIRAAAEDGNVAQQLLDAIYE